MKKRLYYLDYLRVVLTVLVIVHHTAIAYGAGGSWIYKDSDVSTELTVSAILLTIFTAVNQSFFMGFFFFISGYFTPGSYDRKGWAAFLKERFIRLGIPLLVYIFILGPIITYIAHFRQTMSLMDYYSSVVFTFDTVHMGPLWFVQALLYFNLVYVLFRAIIKKGLSMKHDYPSIFKILMTALILGIVAFLLRLVYPVGKDWLGLQFGYFPSYILLFIVGILSYRHKWLDQLDQKLVKKWRLISLVAIPVLPLALVATGALDGTLQFEGGMNLQAFVYALWEPFVAFGIILWLLHYFGQRVNNHSPFKTTLSNTAYTVFIIHPIVVVGLTMFFEGLLPYPSVKFFIVSVIGTVLCFSISYLIIKIPYARRVL